MTQTLRTIMFLIISLAAPSSLLAEDDLGNWNIHDHQDDFDGFIKMSAVTAGSNSIIVRGRGGKVDIYIIARGHRICGNHSDDVYADFIIDGKRYSKIPMWLADSRDSLFFPPSQTKTWLKRINEGRNLKMRYADTCGNRATLEFDIRGHTRFRHELLL